MRASPGLRGLLLGSIVALAACGGPTEPAGEDAGQDGGPGLDAPPDTPCTADTECDDGVFCNGPEACTPGASGADARGCVAGTPPACEPGASCDESLNSCVTSCADADGDGATASSCGGTDCDDTDERRFPGGVEVCDAMGLDEDCDSTTLGDDADSDGYVATRCCNRLPAGRLDCGTDCNDADPSISPAASDPCGGGDQDCDTVTDENPDQTFYRDVDADGHGVVTDTIVACSAPSGYAVIAGDCDDSRSAVNPGVPEACNLIDDNCIDGTDEGCGCTPDGRSEACGPPDEVGECTFGSRTCVAGEWSSCSGAIYPSTEVCEGNFDENCDGTVDEGCECVNGTTRTCGMAVGVCRSVLQTCSGGLWPRDCMDETGVVWPGTEVCDGMLDENCDGGIDEGCECVNGRVDRTACGTDTGECVSGMRVCTSGTWGACSGGTGPATEVCEGARDENCDGAIDEGCTCVNGTTRPCGTGACAGTQTCTGGMWADCSGAAPSTEICNGVDDDCDGVSDPADVGVAMVGSSCGTSTGLCTTGTYSCPVNTLVCSGVAATSEVCDHRDQDCDGLLDDGVGVATCTFSDTGLNFEDEFTCSWGACTGSGDTIGFASATGGDVGRIAVLRASELPDWGRSMSVTARFNMAWRSGTAFDYATGRFGVIVTPQQTPSAETDVGSTASNPLPTLTGTQRGYAALIGSAFGLLQIELWELTPTGNYRRAFTNAPAACHINTTTSYEYRITLSNSGESYTASLTTNKAGCTAAVTATYAVAATTWQQYVYGDSETLAYPRYHVGAYGDNDGPTTANLARFDVTRTSTSDRGHCITCPW